VTTPVVSTGGGGGGGGGAISGWGLGAAGTLLLLKKLADRKAKQRDAKAAGQL
jgi:hypothetical protein